jgi:polyphosphate kinase 2 (PPK2 family)
VRYGDFLPAAEPEWNRPALGGTKIESQRLDKRGYEKELERLQVELVRLQDGVVHERLKVVVLFEGRDTAARGERSNGSPRRPTRGSCVPSPRGTPTERERTQSYFQRYVAHLPAVRARPAALRDHPDQVLAFGE